MIQARILQKQTQSTQVGASPLASTTSITILHT